MAWYEHFCESFTELFNEDLNKLHTKQLLNKLNSMRRCNFDEFQNNECEQCMFNRNKNRENIKSILTDRPHIMNKKESKEHRKLLKKIGN